MRILMVAGALAAMNALLAFSAEPRPQADAKTLAGDVVRAVRETGVFPTPKALMGRPDILPMILKEMRSLEPRVRQNLLANALEVGADPEYRQARWLFSRELVSFLLQVMKDDDNADVRNSAAKALTHSFPDSYFRAHTDEIIDLAQRHVSDWDVYILGKTGAIEARDLLKADKRYSEENPRSYELALAKLGDIGLVSKFVAKYRNEKNPTEKALCAWELGYIGTPESVLALAQDMRTHVVVKLPSRGERSLRVDIVKSLGMVYPEDQLFWISPVAPPSDDTWYKNIEDALEKRFSITWKETRPEFLFETQGPGGGRR